jgi:hypothetical protein
MGYTHYWTFKKPAKGDTLKLERAYQRAIKACQKIIYTYNQELKQIDAKHEGRLSGFCAHTKPGTYGGVKLNGTDENAHEDFLLREHYKQNLDESTWGFCKTAHKPYDVVVVACLVTLKRYLKGYVEVSSDGDAADWAQGTMLARAILDDKKIVCPIPRRETNKRGA